jgi:hypothetical protein
VETDACSLEWAAGLFEGEGCFSLDGCYPQAKLEMNDEATVRKFHSIIGVGAVYPIRRKGSTPSWEWKVGNFEGFQPVTVSLWKWLGPRRRARASECMRIYQGRPAARAMTVGA